MQLRNSFHAIILLISLSLAGIIFLQYQWLYTMLIHKQRAFKEKMITGIEGAWRSLEDGKNMPPAATDPSLPPGFSFSAAQVRMALFNAFTAQGLSGLRFEYTLAADPGYPDGVISSPGFRALVRDSVQNKVLSFIYLSSYNKPPMLTVLVTGIKSRLLREMSWMIAGAALCTFIIIVVFCIMINAVMRQRKLNRLRQYFINNMADAFTTPLSAISMAADALSNEKVMYDKARLDYFSAVIKEENSRLQKHLEAVLHTPLKLYRAALKRVRRKT